MIIIRAERKAFIQAKYQHRQFVPLSDADITVPDIHQGGD